MNMMDEAASSVERIRASRGNYEAEISCNGEAGLHQCAIMCEKNPGHDNFIPVKKFNIDQLPLRYRHKLLVDYVRATSDLTCRLSLSRISKDRPETWPDSEQAYPFSGQKGESYMSVGTGWVGYVAKYTNEKNILEQTWGVVYIHTACHVIHNNEEARHTKCQFFYDSHETDVNKVPTLIGLKVSERDIKGDWCSLKYVTHDVDLLDRFYEMYRRWCDLRDEVMNKYVNNHSPLGSVPNVGCGTNDVNHDLCIVVAHPHGCTKTISIGTWTNRKVVKKYRYNSNRAEVIIYNYNTPTCPGSSGACVITLCKDDVMSAMVYDHPPHNQGGLGNDNSSGHGREYV